MMDDPKNCVIGVTNAKEIENVKAIFELTVERIDKALKEITENQKENFNKLERKLDTTMDTVDDMKSQFNEIKKCIQEEHIRLDEQDAILDNLDVNIDNKIVARLDKNLKNRIYNVMKFIFVGLLVPVAVAILTKLAFIVFNMR